MREILAKRPGFPDNMETIRPDLHLKEND